MASKMLLIITYSSMVFWLMLSVTCKQICLHLCLFSKHSPNSITLKIFHIVFFWLCSVSPSPDTAAVWDKGSSDSLTRLHKGGRPVSPSSPAGDTNTRNDANEPFYPFYYIHIFYSFLQLSDGVFPHIPSSFAQPCQTPWACWWCQSQMLTCSSGEPLGKVHRESGRGAQRLLKEWMMWFDKVNVILVAQNEINTSEKLRCIDYKRYR